MIYYLILLISLTISWSGVVSGYVKDNITGKSIPNANIIIKETGQGAVSSPYGFFKMNQSSF